MHPRGKWTLYLKIIAVTAVSAGSALYTLSTNVRQNALGIFVAEIIAVAGALALLFVWAFITEEKTKTV